MNPIIRAALQNYGPALAVTVVAVLLRWIVDPWAGEIPALAAIYAAVGIATFLGGYPAGIFSTALGFLATWYLFIEPRGSLMIGKSSDFIILFAYLLICLPIVLIVQSLRGAQQQARTMQRSYRESQAQLDREIAEHSRDEAAWKSLHQRNATILGSISDAFFAFDREWRIVVVNNQAERYIGCPREELLGRVLWQAYPQLVGTNFEREYRRAVAENVSVQFEAQSPVTGRWLELHAYPSSDGLSVLFQDVTDRRKTLAEIEAKEAQLRLITGAVPALISYIDTEGRYVWNNEAYQAWFGLAGESLTGRHLRDVLGAAAWQTIEPRLMAALAGQRIQYSTQVTHQSGGRRWIDVTYTPDVAPDGAVRGVVGLVHDVTKRQEMEESLRQSEQRFKALIDNSWDGIVVVSRSGEVTFVSPSVKRLLDYDPAELLDRHVCRLIHPDDREAAESAMAELLASPGVRISRHFRFQHKDGRWRRVEGVAVNLLHEAAVGGLVCNFRDATEQVEAQEALLASQQRFVRFMQHLPGLAWIKDAEGRYVYANEAAMRAFGARSERLYGHTDDDLFPAETAAQFRVNDARARNSPAGIQIVETLRQDDGQLHYSLVSKFPIPDPDGAVRLIGGVAIDITELKQAEQALRDADRRKDEFLATLAHELRNPLAPIRSAVHILQLEGAPPKDVEASRQVIERQLSQLVRLVDDLLDVSRITRSKLQLRTARIRLDEAISSAVETSQPIIAAAGHELIISVPPETLEVDADLTRLAQVFSNLLNNAAKYTDPGGEIRLSVWREGSDAVVSIADTGIGIAAEQLPRIFEMFSQVTPAIERTQGGLGIGLSLVRGLVEMHGGTIEARSDGPGQGSEFRVRLPLLLAVSAEAPQVSLNPEAPHSECGSRRILVVDDNEDAANSMSAMLSVFGHEVQTAYDGDEGLKAAASFRPQVVLLDIGMPQLNGYEVARCLRAAPGGAEFLLIALTGWGQDNDKRLAREAGFDYHLIKPVNPTELQRLIATSRQAAIASPP